MVRVVAAVAVDVNMVRPLGCCALKTHDRESCGQTCKRGGGGESSSSTTTTTTTDNDGNDNNSKK